jgi:hypothetical protein
MADEELSEQAAKIGATSANGRSARRVRIILFSPSRWGRATLAKSAVAGGVKAAYIDRICYTSTHMGGRDRGAAPCA